MVLLGDLDLWWQKGRGGHTPEDRQVLAELDLLQQERGDAHSSGSTGAGDRRTGAPGAAEASTELPAPVRDACTPCTVTGAGRGLPETCAR